MSSNEKKKKEKLKKIRHDLKGSIRKQGMIFDYLMKQLRRERQVDKSVFVDMNNAIEYTMRDWQLFQNESKDLINE